MTFVTSRWCFRSSSDGRMVLTRFVSSWNPAARSRRSSIWTDGCRWPDSTVATVDWGTPAAAARSRWDIPCLARASRTRRAAAAAVLLVGALLAGGLTAAVASAKPAPDAAVDDVIVVQPFAADSGDRCPRGFTKGQLGWHAGAL